MARIFTVTINALDPVALGRFWSAAVGYSTVTETEALVRPRSSDSGPDMLLLRVDRSPERSALHLDLAADDPNAEVVRLSALGAHPVDTNENGAPAARTANSISWFVMTDPEGNEFCIGGEPPAGSEGTSAEETGP